MKSIFKENDLFIIELSQLLEKYNIIFKDLNIFAENITDDKKLDNIIKDVNNSTFSDLAIKISALTNDLRLTEQCLIKNELNKDLNIVKKKSRRKITFRGVKNE